MVYSEKQIGDGVYAADENNDRNSARGSFVRNGGAVTVGASSTDVVVNIDAADIRLDATDYSLASGSVPLADNSTAYPRRDLVFARSGSFDFMTGNPIEQDTFDTLVAEGVIDGDGLPIHKPEDIPEIQPPAFQGERATATLLAMVYVPPETTDSTNLSGEYITDLRMEGIGVGDVLRSGDAIENIEALDRDLDVSVTEFASATRPQLTERSAPLTIDPPGNSNQGSSQSVFFNIPDGFRFQVWRVTLTVERNYTPDGIELEVSSVNDNTGSDKTLLHTFSGATTMNSDGTPAYEFAGTVGGKVLEFRLVNGSAAQQNMTANVSGYLIPS
jgi:hypothetical protein